MFGYTDADAILMPPPSDRYGWGPVAEGGHGPGPSLAPPSGLAGIRCACERIICTCMRQSGAGVREGSCALARAAVPRPYERKEGGPNARGGRLRRVWKGGPGAFSAMDVH